MTIGLADIHECLRNPSKLRILLMLKKNGPMTAKQMLTEGVGVSQTTLYRLLSSMQETGVLAVVSENRVRALIEKTYDASTELKEFDVDLLRSADVREYCKLFSGFAMDLVREFEMYSERPGANLSQDRCGFASVTVFMTPDEIREVSARMNELLEPYLLRSSAEQSARTLSVIVTPPREGDDEGADSGWSEDGNLMRMVR